MCVAAMITESLWKYWKKWKKRVIVDFERIGSKKKVDRARNFGQQSLETPYGISLGMKPANTSHSMEKRKKTGKNSKKNFLGFFRSKTLKNVILRFVGFDLKNPNFFFFLRFCPLFFRFSMCVTIKFTSLPNFLLSP